MQINTIFAMVKIMLFYGMPLNYCNCGGLWGISFETFGSSRKMSRKNRKMRTVNFSAHFSVMQIGYRTIKA